MFGIATLDLDMKITQWAGWLADLTGQSEGDVLGRVILEVFPDLEARGFEAIFQHVLDTRAPLVLSHILHEYIFPAADGPPIPQAALVQPIRQNEILTGLLIAVQDVSGRREMEDELRLRLQHLEALHCVDQLVLCGELDATLDAIVKQTVALFGAVHADITLLESDRLVLAAAHGLDWPPDVPHSLEVGRGIIGRAARSGQLVQCPDVSADPDYVPIDVRTVGEMAAPIRTGKQTFGVLNVESDSSAGFDADAPQILQSLADEAAIALRADQALRKEARRLRSLELLRELGLRLTAAGDLQTIYDLGVECAVRLLDASAAVIYRYEPHLDTARAKGSQLDETADTGLRFAAGPGIPGLPRREFSAPRPGGLTHTVARSRQPLVVNDTAPHLLYGPQWMRKWNLTAIVGYPLLCGENLLGVLNVSFTYAHTIDQAEAELLSLLAEQLANHIENTRLHELTLRSLARVDALRRIDQAITASFDLKLSLNVLLKQLLTQLEVDAAAVLRYQEDLQTLTFSQAQGFRTTALQHTYLRLGQSYAGEVALQRRNIFIPDLNQGENSLLESPHFREEGFLAYYGVPLIAKGKLIGVLEIFHRSALNPDAEWVDYLQLLAGQAAIAIDNITLFNGLQRTNVKLALAYDATIEGWARALELRDMETEGHSRRVVGLTVQLARKMGIGDEDLVHIRRGALLHDIGKMGVPDRSLQNPGPLTDEEWQIMHQHPVYAYKWLSPIEYLRPALDIPYCHHEKWDGAGYPRGLQGEQIPLSARIFAVVDVYDALNSDRPYRKAWPAEKTLTYIREQRGIHFAPQVVDVFLKLIH